MSRDTNHVRYHTPAGGLPGQRELTTDRARFTQAYAVIPKGTMRDITTQDLPHWDGTRVWVIARPMSGFAETFSQYLVQVAPGGGSEDPENDPGAEAVLFVVGGELTLTLGAPGGPAGFGASGGASGSEHVLAPGGYAFLPPGQRWTLRNTGSEAASFHWVRKRYEKAEGVEVPAAFVTSDADVEPTPMPDTDGAWATTRFVDPHDVRHDMHVTIVTLAPGAAIPFPETHVMEHGLFVLEGKAVYLLNEDWVEVEAGDFMWLRAFCPQACYAGGPDRFRYLLYKDMHRHARLGGVLGR